MEFSAFLAKARAAHGDRYDYPAWDAPRKSKDRVGVLCPVHGLFEQMVNSHVHGRCSGCRQCALEANWARMRMVHSDFVVRAAAVHGGKYDYPHNKLQNANTKIAIICPTHGEFLQEPASHLSGCGCPECGRGQRIKTKRRSFDEFLAKARAKHGDRFSYPDPGPGNFQGLRAKTRIVCPDHGEFLQGAAVHIRSPFSCPKCSAAHIGSLTRLTGTGVNERLEERHPGKAWAYVRSTEDRLVFHCSDTWADGSEHGQFSMTTSNFAAGKGCPACVRRRSWAEREIRDYIRSLGFSTVRGSNRTIPGLGRYELDVAIPELKIAVEYNGLIWHSELFQKERLAHVKKTELAESLGYRLIHVFEDEWLEKRDIVEARLAAILGSGLRKMGARETTVKNLTWKVAAAFLQEHHMQGAGSPAAANFGLVTRAGELVAVASFGGSRYTGHDWELLRFVSSCRVVGGMGKLLAAFKQTAEPGQSLISFADRRWSDGNLYKTLGFAFAGNTEPNYSYMSGQRRYSRHGFQKHKLQSRLKTFDSSLSEVENCKRNGFHRVFDCGSSRWTLNL